MLTHCWKSATALMVALPYLPSAESAGIMPMSTSSCCTLRTVLAGELASITPLKASTGRVVGVGVGTAVGAGVAVGTAVALRSLAHSSA